MANNIRLWEIGSDQKPNEILSDQIALEARLEDWLEADISMLDPGLLVIGRQVRTDFGGEIDLLCLDADGNVVVVELKKGTTPRDVTAQILEYASWARHLSYDRITEIAEDYFSRASTSITLENAFPNRFGTDRPLPEVLNEEHRALIVAESTDASTDRIVQYLSDMNVPINVATVQHFKSADGRELLAQVFLVEPEVAATKSRERSRRRPLPTAAEMQAVADEKGVGELYKRLSSSVSGVLRAASFGKDRRGFSVAIDGSLLAVMAVGLGESGVESGMQFELHGNRLEDHFGLDSAALKGLLPHSVEVTEGEYWTHRGFFSTEEEITRFVQALRTNRT